MHSVDSPLKQRSTEDHDVADEFTGVRLGQRRDEDSQYGDEQRRVLAAGRRRPNVNDGIAGRTRRKPVEQRRFVAQRLRCVVAFLRCRPNQSAPLRITVRWAWLPTLAFLDLRHSRLIYSWALYTELSFAQLFNAMQFECNDVMILVTPVKHRLASCSFPDTNRHHRIWILDMMRLANSRPTG